MTPLTLGVFRKDPTLKRVFTAKFAPQICASTRSIILAHTRDFRNWSLEATVVFLLQFLLQKTNTFVCRIFGNQSIHFGCAKIIPHRPRLVNRDKPLRCIFTHLNFFGFFVYNRIHDDKRNQND
jgi:hypothetical protein